MIEQPRRLILSRLFKRRSSHYNSGPVPRWKHITRFVACSAVVYAVICAAGGCGPGSTPAGDEDGTPPAYAGAASDGNASAGRKEPRPPPIAETLTPEMLSAAQQQFESTYKRKADKYDTLSWLGELAGRAGRLRHAITAFSRIPSSHPRYGHSARYQQAQYLMKLNRVRDAEENLHEFLQLESENQQMKAAHTESALWQLNYLYGIELRLKRRHKVLAVIHRMGKARIEESLGYCYPSLHRWNGSDAVTAVEEFLKVDPGDFYLRLALGRYRTMRGRIEDAWKILQECYTEQPDNLQLAGARAECLVEQDDMQAVDKLLAELPAVAATDPLLLLNIRGRYYHRQEQYKTAIECFEYAIKTDPSNAEAYLGLARAYSALKQTAKQKETLHITRGLARIQNRIGGAQEDVSTAAALQEIIEISFDIGLEQEARIMLETAIRDLPDYEPFKRLQREHAPGKE